MTPAPVFAYRALKSIFFASPESSPEHENKENTPPKDGSHIKLGQSRREQELESTPHKHEEYRINALSPTKGILRTPGVPTPRTRLLKDINVKFKSVSPETKPGDNQASMKANTEGMAGAKGSDQTKDTKAAEAEAVTNKSTSLKSEKHARVMAINATDSRHVTVDASQALSTFDVDSYIRRTEKEIKKLVRHGQKMKEFAQKKDAENVELRKMVDQLREQNERLNRSILEGGPQRSLTHRAHRARSDTAHESASRDSRREKAKSGDSGLMDQPVIRSISQGPPRSVGLTSTSTPRPAGRNASLEDGQLLESRVMQCSEGLRKGQHRGTDPREGDMPMHTYRPPSTSTTGSVRLPPDKLAAARERLRKKAELRRASAETGESQLDWANL